MSEIEPGRLISLIGGEKFYDPAPGYFANNLVPKKVHPKQLVPVVHQVMQNVSRIPFDPWERDATRLLRNGKDMSRIMDMTKFTLTGNLIRGNEGAMLLPHDNVGFTRKGTTKKFVKTVKGEYLSYRSPLWTNVMTDLANRIIHDFSGDPDVVDAASGLLVDYSVTFPFREAIRHDGSRNDDPNFPTWKTEGFRRVYENAMSKIFSEHKLEDSLPGTNPAKSTGPITTWPDGRKYDPPYFGPVEYKERKAFSLMKKNNKALKLAYCEDGTVYRLMEDLYANYEKFDSDVECFTKVAKHGSVSSSSQLVRKNCPDHTTVDISGGVIPKKHYGKLVTKPRRVGFEEKEGYWTVGETAPEKLAEWYRKNIGVQLVADTYRDAFANSTATTAIRGLYLTKKLYHPLEVSSRGFPSLNPKVLARYDEFFSRYAETHEIYFISSDRHNAEQYITDNYKNMEKLVGMLWPYFKAESYTLLPSYQYGMRATKGLVSGSPITTAANINFGLYQQTDLVIEVLSDLYPELKKRKDYCDLQQQILTCVLDECSSAFVEFNGIILCPNLGTDDQITIVAVPKSKRWVPKVPEGYDHWLSVDILREATTFGMKFTERGVRAASVLGLDKLFYVEKSSVGDIIASRYAVRLDLLPQFRPYVDAVFYDWGLGDPADYYNALPIYTKRLAMFGYDIDPDLNQYSPKSMIWFSEAAVKGIIPSFNERTREAILTYTEANELLTSSNQYPIEYIQPIEEFFKNLIFTRSM